MSDHSLPPPPTTNPHAGEVGSPLSSPLVLWRAIRKNWVVIVGIAAAVVLAATFFTLGQKKVYRASTTIQIDPTPPRPLGTEVQGVVEMGTGTYLNNREYYETQYKVIQSGRVAGLVVRELALHRDAPFLTNAPPGENPAPFEVPVEAAAEVLRSRLEVEPIKNSRLTIISFEDADPARAERIVMMVVEKYREQNLDTVLASTNSALDWLRDQLSKLKTELESSEMGLHEYKKNKNILSVSIDDQSNMLRAEMAKLNDTLTDLKSRKENISARYTELAKVNSDDPHNLPSTELLNNVLLQNLRRDYVEAVRNRDSLVGSGKGPNHHEVAAADARVQVTRKALLAEVKNVRGAVHRDLAAVTREVSGVNTLFEGARKRALELNLLEIEYNRLKRSKENTEKLYGLVLDRTKESDLTRMMRVNNINVVDAALVPKRPVRPSVPLNIALGLLAGLALGVGLAIGRELLDRSVKTPDDIEREIGVTFLGLLPQVEDGGRGNGTYGPRRRRGRRGRREPVQSALAPELIVHEFPMSGVAEAARAVRTNILFMAPDHPYRTLLITSAAPMEGKTTVATCIAVAMAQAGQRVVLVDCDMRRPRLHKIFGRSSSEGVTTAMLDIDTLDEMSLETEVPNLSMLQCGPIPPNPAELLHSDSFGKVLSRLRERFDRVVIDSPPMLPVTDAAVLSTRVDGTVLVIRAFKTTKDMARQATRGIRDVGGRLVGCVLNAVDLNRREYSYYDYYYAKEGYGARPEEEPPSRSSAASPPPAN